MRQFELGGMAVMSETFILATSTGPPGANSVEYLMERMSSGSSTGRTTSPPSWLFPPSRTSRLKSTTCDPSVEKGARGGRALTSTDGGTAAPLTPVPVTWRDGKMLVLVSGPSFTRIGALQVFPLSFEYWMNTFTWSE